MLEIIVVTIFISTVINLFLKRYEIPTIIWYISTWIIISYLFWLQNLNSNYELKIIAEFWIVFLMFTIWLEFSIKHLINMKKNVFLFWWLQVLISSIIFFILSNYFFWFDLKSSIIIWLWLSLSSTAIVLKLLNESHDISKEYWQKSFWILLFQDLAVIPILLLIWMFSDSSSQIFLLFWKTLLSSIILIFLLWFFWKYLLNIFFEKITKTNSSEIFISAIFLIVMWSSYLAHYLWLSYSLWALIAWILIAETHYKHQVEADLSPFRDLLLWVFFITVWMQLNFSIILENLFYIILFLTLIILIKIIIIFSILSFWTKKRTAFQTALSLFQVWEFSIVIFELASSKNILDTNISQILIVIIILSMIITPLILKKLSNISNFVSKKFFINENSQNFNLKETIESNDIVLIGYWRLWKTIAWMLENKWYKFLIIEKDHHVFKKAKHEWKPIIFWNAHQKHILESLNINNASNIIISVWNNEKLYLICEAIVSIAKNSKIIVKANKYEEKEMLQNLNLQNIIVETEETALSMMRKMEEQLII